MLGKFSPTWSWLLLGLLVGGLALGCGGEPTPMSIKNGVAAAGDASDPKTPDNFAATRERLVGKWQGSFEINPEITDAELPPVHRQQLDSTLMTVDFGGNGQVTMTAEVTFEGMVRSTDSQASWEVADVEGDRVVVESTEENMAPEQIEIEFAGASEFYMSLPEGQSHIGRLRFRRQ